MSRRFFCPRKERKKGTRCKKSKFVFRKKKGRKTMVLETQAVVNIHISIICKH